MKPVIFSLAGTELSEEERAFFQDAQPAGYILFGRNIADREQLRALTDSLRALHGRDDLPILIDQEGGRVARLKPPHWPTFPAPGSFDALYDLAPSSAIEAVRCNAQAMALVLADVGITVDCTPSLDLRHPGAHDIVGDRALGGNPMQVAALGRAVIDGLAAGGVVGVIKHMPGHGRAHADSHLEMPVVDADPDALAEDLKPFQSLARAPMGMTAHILFPAWDKERPASLSPSIIRSIIRERIGFDGLLMSDDLDMKALTGSIPERARDVIAAGTDLALYCWGRMEDMRGIANILGEMPQASRDRLDRAMASVRPDSGQTIEALVAKRDALLALA